jgi:hypothetical protein
MFKDELETMEFETLEYICDMVVHIEEELGLLHQNKSTSATPKVQNSNLLRETKSPSQKVLQKKVFHSEGKTHSTLIRSPDTESAQSQKEKAINLDLEKIEVTLQPKHFTFQNSLRKKTTEKDMKKNRIVHQSLDLTKQKVLLKKFNVSVNFLK